MDTTIIATCILGGTGIIITAYYSWHAKKIANEQMLKQLFTEFNKRYSDLNDSLVEIKENFSKIEDLTNSDREYELRNKVNDFFNLCAEEFYWCYHKKRIDPLIWKSWHAGMNDWYRVPIIKELWKNEIKANGKDSYYINDKIEFFTDKSPI